VGAIIAMRKDFSVWRHRLVWWRYLLMKEEGAKRRKAGMNARVVTSGWGRKEAGAAIDKAQAYIAYMPCTLGPHHFWRARACTAQRVAPANIPSVTAILRLSVLPLCRPHRCVPKSRRLFSASVWRQTLFLSARNASRFSTNTHRKSLARRASPLRLTDRSAPSKTQKRIGLAQTMIDNRTRLCTPAHFCVPVSISFCCCTC